MYDWFAIFVKKRDICKQKSGRLIPDRKISHAGFILSKTGVTDKWVNLVVEYPHIRIRYKITLKVLYPNRLLRASNQIHKLMGKPIRSQSDFPGTKIYGLSQHRSGPTFGTGSLKI